MEYILTLGKLSAKVNSLGAELVSFKNGEYEHIWQGDPAFWSGQNPNLFPNIGAVKEYGACFGGKPYPLVRHGFARRSEFALVEKTDTSVTLELRENPSTLKVYPFPFSLRVTHTLLPDGFSTKYTVSNPGESPLPFCIGGHPAFNCPGDFSSWRLVFEKIEDAHALLPLPGGFISTENREYVLQKTDTLPLRHEDFDRVDTFIFPGLESKAVSLLGPGGHGLRMVFADFPMIAFWTAPDKNAPYLCMEPWQGCGALADESGEFSEKYMCLSLDPGGCKSLEYSLSII